MLNLGTPEDFLTLNLNDYHSNKAKMNKNPSLSRYKSENLLSEVWVMEEI